MVRTRHHESIADRDRAGRRNKSALDQLIVVLIASLRCSGYSVLFSLLLWSFASSLPFSAFLCIRRPDNEGAIAGCSIKLSTISRYFELTVADYIDILLAIGSVRRLHWKSLSDFPGIMDSSASNESTRLAL